MKSSIKILTVLCIFASVVACKKDSRPNYQFMPNMYEPVGYEAYGEYEIFANEQEAKLPAEGSVPRGELPFDIENSTEGYEEAKATLKNPLDSMKLAEYTGGQLYDIYCAICHGKKGDGQGGLVKSEKILGVPAYNDAGRAITEGSVYHTIYYGKNTMGSYANQLNETERWQVVDYVMNLKSELGGSTEKAEATTENDSI